MEAAVGVGREGVWRGRRDAGGGSSGSGSGGVVVVFGYGGIVTWYWSHAKYHMSQVTWRIQLLRSP